jgi:hypothetical protein
MAVLLGFRVLLRDARSLIERAFAADTRRGRPALHGKKDRELPEGGRA